jgi:hypothetical protein
MSNINDKNKQKPQITGLKASIGKSGYKSYMEKFLSKVEENKNYFEKIEVSPNKEFKINKNQIVLRQIIPVVVWIDITASKKTHSDDIKMDFVDPEHIPAINLTKVDLDFSKEENLETETKKDFKNQDDSILKFFYQQKENISVDKQKIKKIKEKLNKENYFNEKDEKKGFLAGFLETLKSDFFWQAIALTMLLAVFLFYFQGLQPAILKTYSNQTQTQLDEVAVSFNNQLKSFFEIQTLASSRFNYDSTLLCNETKLYQTISQDMEEINRIKIKLLPSQNLTELKTVGPFYESKIYEIYQGFYQKYDQDSRNLENNADEFLILLQFLNYRNSWIQTCQNLQENSFSEQSRLDACQEIITGTEVFKNQPNWDSLNSEIKNRIQDGLNLCLEDSENLASQWFNKYDMIMAYEPDFTTMNQEMVGVQENFKGDLVDTKLEIREVVNKKTKFSGIFYILNF